MKRPKKGVGANFVSKKQKKGGVLVYNGNITRPSEKKNEKEEENKKNKKKKINPSLFIPPPIFHLFHHTHKRHPPRFHVCKSHVSKTERERETEKEACSNFAS